MSKRRVPTSVVELQKSEVAKDSIRDNFNERLVGCIVEGELGSTDSVINPADRFSLLMSDVEAVFEGNDEGLFNLLFHSVFFEILQLVKNNLSARLLDPALIPDRLREIVILEHMNCVDEHFEIQPSDNERDSISIVLAAESELDAVSVHEYLERTVSQASLVVNFESNIVGHASSL